LHLFGFLGLEFSDVEVEFFAFKDVSVASAGLTWSGSNTGKETTLGELFNQSSGNFGFLSASVKFLLNGGRFWSVEESFVLFRQFSVLLAAKSLSVVRFVPLSEWGRIDGYDATFDQSLGSDQFVVGGVVDNIDNTNFSCTCFSSPREIA